MQILGFVVGASNWVNQFAKLHHGQVTWDGKMGYGHPSHNGNRYDDTYLC